MKILALTHPGTNSRGLLLDIVWGFRELGHDVIQFQLEPIWSMREAASAQAAAAAGAATRLILEMIDHNSIDLSIAMWANGTRSMGMIANADGTIASALERHGHPHVHYWWDAPHWANEGREIEMIGRGLYRGVHQFHCINNPGTGAEMAGLMGFRNVLAAPNGVNPTVFRPRPDVRREYDLVFLTGAGDPPPRPIMLKEVEADEPDLERIRRDVAESLADELDVLARQFPPAVAAGARELLSELVEERLSHRHTPAITHVQQVLRRRNDLAPAVDALVRDIPRYIAATRILRQIETWERPFMTAYLSRHFRCLRVGPAADTRWDIRSDHCEFAPYERQSELYARGHFALNVMRWQDDVGVNSKIFEITASGTGCLQAYRAGVEDLFVDGEEILTFRTPAEARERLRDALSRPDFARAVSTAGHERTLRDHTWDKRMAGVVAAVEQYWRKRGRTSAMTPAPLKARRAVSPTGENLAFILSPMRGGSTLLRKMLDAHPNLVSPAETWFLLPLLNLWSGVGQSPHFNVAQAAAALKSISSRDQFVQCCREFASALYSGMMRSGAACVIDKTPIYLNIADELAAIFPHAKYIILVRDPRGTLWSMHTWKDAPSPGIDALIEYAAERLITQTRFLKAHHDQCAVVRYEDLCENPEPTCRSLCEFLRVPFDRAMIDYGQGGKSAAGYGDRNTLQHSRPHTASVARWQLDDQQQQRLAQRCTPEALRHFGYEELAGRAKPAQSVEEKVNPESAKAAASIESRGNHA